MIFIYFLKDEFQIFVTGIALGLKQPSKKLPNITTATGEDELIFKLEEEHTVDLRGAARGSVGPSDHSIFQSVFKLKISCYLQTSNKAAKRYGVDITPLTYVPGGRVDKYLGNLNFFFIRESTSIRENGGISGFVHSFITEVRSGRIVKDNCLP